MAGCCLCCWAMVTPGIGEALAQPKLIIVDTANDRSGNAAAPANVARNMDFIETTGIDGVALTLGCGLAARQHAMSDRADHPTDSPSAATWQASS